MNEAATSKPGGSPITVFFCEMIAGLLFLLGLFSGIVLLLLPLGVLPHGYFLVRPQRSLWLLFILGLVFGSALFWLGATNRTTRRLEKGDRSRFLVLRFMFARTLSKVLGVVFLTLGLLSALEIFVQRALPDRAPNLASVWGLFVIFTLIGGIYVYVPMKVEMMERHAQEEECKAAAEQRRAEEQKRKVSLRIVRLKVPDYYACEKLYLIEKKQPHKRLSRI